MTQSKKIDVILDKNTSVINSIHDKVMLQILQDSLNENDEPLRLIEKRIWDPTRDTAKFDVKDSQTWKLVYAK